MPTYWLEFDNDSRAAIVEAADLLAAVRRAWKTECHPGGSITSAVLGEEQLASLAGVPRDTLLDAETLRSFGLGEEERRGIRLDYWTTHPTGDGSVDVLMGGSRYATFRDQLRADLAITAFEAHAFVVAAQRGMLDDWAGERQALTARLLDEQRRLMVAGRRSRALEMAVVAYHSAYTAVRAMPEHRMAPGDHMVRVWYEEQAREHLFGVLAGLGRMEREG